MNNKLTLTIEEEIIKKLKNILNKKEEAFRNLLRIIFNSLPHLKKKSILN